MGTPESSAPPAARWAGVVSRRFLWVLASGTIVYVALALLQSSDLDEGGYLLAAVQVAHGQVPFVNFVGIEPVVPYYLSLGVLLFGPSLVVARLQLVVLVLATSAGIYAIGRSQHSEGAGLLASGVFLFSPLSLYYNSIVILEAASLAPLVFAAVLLLRPRPERPFLPAVAIGCLLGVAVLTRRDTALLAPLFLTVLVYRERVGRMLTVGLGFVAGVAVTVVPVLGYFTLRTSVAWMYAQYGFGAAYAASRLSLPFHVGVLAYGVLTLPALALGITGVGAWYLRGRGHATAARWALRVAGVPVVLVLAVGLSFQSWGQGESLFSAVAAEFVILVVMWVALRFVLSEVAFSDRAQSSVVVPFLLAWVGLVLVFFTLVYPTFFVHYLIEVTAPASLLVGLYFADLIARSAATNPVPRAPSRYGRGLGKRLGANGRRAVLIGVVATVLVVPSVTGAALILGPFNDYNNPYADHLPAQNLYQRVYPLAEIQQVADYLDTHSASNATVFTADSIFAAAANRLVLLNLSTVIDDYAYPPSPLGMNQSPLGYDPYDLAPTLSEIFSAWNRTYVPYVIVGNRTLSFESVTPYFVRYLELRYHPVAVFDPGLLSQEVVVEELGVAPGGAALSATVPIGTAPTGLAVDTRAHVAFVSDASSPAIEVVNESGGRYSVDLPVGTTGVTSLEISPTGATLLATTPRNSLLVYNVSSTGTLALRGAMELPGPVSSWAYGSNATLVYAAIPSQSEVLAVDTSGLTVAETYETGPETIAVAVSGARGELAVVEQGHATLALYDLTSGTHLVNYGLGPRSANFIAFEGEQVVGVQAQPSEVFWLNLTTGHVDVVDSLGGVAGDPDVVAGLLLVGNLDDGTVSVFNATTAEPVGSIDTSGCPQFVVMDPGTRALWSLGACASEAQLWTLPPTVPLSLNGEPGLSVSVNGFDDPTLGTSQVLPGTYEIRAVGGGGSSIALVVVRGPTVVNITVPDLSGSWVEYQVIFLVVSVAGGAAAIYGVLWLGVRRPEVFFPPENRAMGAR